MSENPTKLGARVVIAALVFIFVIPGLLLFLLIVKPFPPVVQTIWYAALGIFIVALFAFELFGHVFELVQSVRSIGFVRVLAGICVLLVAVLLVIGATYLSPQIAPPAAPSPSEQTTALIDRIHEVLTSIRAKGGKAPNKDNLAEFLNIHTGDPHDLADRFDDESGTFRDAWGNPIEFQFGSFDRFALWSFGPDGVDNQGAGDDIRRGELIVVELSPKDMIVGGIKNLIDRDKAPEEDD